MSTPVPAPAPAETLIIAPQAIIAPPLMTLHVEGFAEIHLRPVPIVVDAQADHVKLLSAIDPNLPSGPVLRAMGAHFQMYTQNDLTINTNERMQAVRNAFEGRGVQVFTDLQTQALRMVYRELVIRFHSDSTDVQRTELLRRYGLILRCRNRYVASQWIIYDPEMRYRGVELVDLANRLSREVEVRACTPNFVSQYDRKAIPAIPGGQWHLSTINIEAAWQRTLGKPGITIAILDDGVDIAHPELKQGIRRNPDPADPSDRYGRDFFVADESPDHFDPRPKRFQYPYEVMSGNDIHGTPCAGVAAGRGPRGLGAAPRCRILPVKVFHADDMAQDARVADAIRYASLHADVLSMSYSGPVSTDVQLALQDTRNLGRKGNGSVLVAAAGNGSGKPVGFPGSDPHVIAVGASTDQDELASYSNIGPEIAVVAPSSGGAKGIYTQDVSQLNRGFSLGQPGGPDLGHHTPDFGGTSSATPLVAGVCALLLSRNPTLSPDEVKMLLQTTAAKIGPPAAYDAQGHSNQFGHGRIDAGAALARA